MARRRMPWVREREPEEAPETAFADGDVLVTSPG
jgi:hypothetical protein